MQWNEIKEGTEDVSERKEERKEGRV